MFLVERFIGVFIYSIVLFYFLFLIYRFKNTKRVLLFYALLLSILAYYYVPFETADLYRITESMHYFSSMNPSEFIKELMQTPTPFYLIYIRMIGFFKNDGLLPAITCFWYYMNVFYMISKSKQAYNLKNSSIVLIVFFLMSFGQYLQVISGIRSMLAFSIGAKCIYTEFFEEKNILRNIPLYLIAIMLHQVGTIVFCYRLFFELFCQRNKTGIKSFLKIFILLITIIIFYRFGSNYLDSALQSSIGYLSSDGYSYFWEYLITGLHLLLIGYGLIKHKRIILESKKIKRYTLFILVPLIIILSLAYEYTIFQRFSVMISMCYVPLLCFFLKYREICKSKNFTFIMIFLCCLILFLACLRGNLSALKFFVLHS